MALDFLVGSTGTYFYDFEEEETKLETLLIGLREEEIADFSLIVFKFLETEFLWLYYLLN